MIFGKKKKEYLTTIGKNIDNPLPRQSDQIKKRPRSLSEVETDLLGDRLSFGILILCVFLFLLQGILILFNWRKLPPELPLFYSRPWGEDVLVRPIFLLILPFIVFSFSAINFGLVIITGENLFLKKVLVIFSAIVSLICTWALVKLFTLLI